MRRRSFTLMLAAATMLSGCALPTSRAGGPDPGVVASLRTPDTTGLPSEAIIAAFVEEIETQTDGALQIEPQWDVPRANTPEDDVARAVAGGDVEFALVPARAWDLLGVESLKVLQLPGLIVSDTAAIAVSSDDAVVVKLLAGLDEVGVTGLALIPEGVRRLYVVPPGTPEAFTARGAGIRSIASEASVELFELVGATTTDASGPELDGQVLSGDVIAVESSWNLLDTVPTGVSAIGDLPLFTKFNVIAVNAEWFAGLTEPERTDVRKAAELAQSRSVAALVPDAEQAAEFCSSGGTIGRAAPETTRVFAAAGATMEGRWRAEPGAAYLIDRLKELTVETGVPTGVAFCTAAPAEPDPQTTAPPRQAFPGGIYRLSVSVEELADAGMSRGDAMNHGGIWTLTFRDGALLMADMGYDCHGRYVVNGERVELHLDREGACGDAGGKMLFSAGWETDGMTLRFVDLISGEGGPGANAFIQKLFQGRPFSKIG